ncbi:MAG: CRISPR system precrRNA processing endoribonuclease RAMP protein Cas6 [Deltaproteobacteria bacterium]|nr:CRISPR system precrRNA processing endoribonuclease RAMP protein Cas6 [Deltaproteobacteria bacterium]
MVIGHREDCFSVFLKITISIPLSIARKTEPRRQQTMKNVAEVFPGLVLSKLGLDVRLSAAARSRLGGSAWRGIMGWELKALVCPMNHGADCKNCLIKSHCPAYLTMEARTDVPGLLDSPRGYVIYCNHEAGEADVRLELTLIGSCSRFYPALCKALLSGGKKGVGPSRIPYRLMAVQVLEPDGSWRKMERPDEPLPQIPAFGPANGAAYRFMTPVRLRKQGNYLGAMDWPFLFQTLARRLEALSVLFCGGEPLGREAWTKLSRELEDCGPIASDLNWMEYERYSNRQERKVPLGGLVGDFNLDAARPWTREWMEAARMVHVGKGAAMGLGRVEKVEG